MEIDRILDLVRPGLGLVQAELTEGVRVRYPIIAAVLENLVAAGGKRLRPAMVLLAAKFNRYDLDVLVPIAASVEMLHTATLVHDDTIDHALLRRGTHTLNSIVDDGVTILMGDYLFAQCAVLIAKPGIPRVTTILATTLASICDGELQQAFTAHQWQLDRSGYSHRIFCKTAVLFSAAAEMGSVASGASEEQVAALKEYGRCVGMAFQIVDDILDFRSSSSELGKPVGNDLRQGIITLPVICFAESGQADEVTMAQLESVVRGDDVEGVDSVIKAIAESGALESAYAEAKSYVQQAKGCLAGLSNAEIRDALHSLADYAVARRT